MSRRLSATDRQLFDVFNARISETDKQRIDAGQSAMVARGNKLPDARAMAEASHVLWKAKNKPTEPN